MGKGNRERENDVSWRGGKDLMHPPNPPEARSTSSSTLSSDSEWSSSTLPASVHYFHDIFPTSFLKKLDLLLPTLEASSASHNMYCSRRFFRDPDLAAELVSHLPPSLQISHVISYMRFLEYPAG